MLSELILRGENVEENRPRGNEEVQGTNRELTFINYYVRIRVLGTLLTLSNVAFTANLRGKYNISTYHYNDKSSR